MKKTVFVSSTSSDLEPYRQAARDVVLDLGCVPEMMEHFGTDAGRTVLTACREKVRCADLVLAIVGWRFGTRVPSERGGDGRRSYTWYEVEAALEEPPRGLILLRADESWPRRLDEQDPAARASMAELRSWLDGLRLARDFAWEEPARDEKKSLPAFRALVRQEVGRWLHEQAVPPGKPVVKTLRLAEWSEPPLPKRPYPVLEPVTHPRLFGGRNIDLQDLVARLEAPVPILGLHAASGAGKSSLLAAGLLPAIRRSGCPASLDRHPAEPGLAGRLAGDLLVDGEGDTDVVADGDVEGFVAVLRRARELAGRPPVLVLDQFEEAFRGPQARARVGPLLAATVARSPGLDGPLCRWVLGYRRDFHGDVRDWLVDVLHQARELGVEGIDGLPPDLSAGDRFHDFPLGPLGVRRGLDAKRGREAAGEAFLDAIRLPLAVTGEDGRPAYPWTFGEGSAERLAEAFAARQWQAWSEGSESPLTPQLQVVLAHLLERAADGSQGVVRIEEREVEGLVGEALERHLERALDRAFPVRRHERERSLRSRVLLGLRRLADAEGRRTDGLPEGDLIETIGRDEGTKVLETLEGETFRVVISGNRPGGRWVRLPHDALAAVIARVVDRESVRDVSLRLDRRLLALRPVIERSTELFAAGEEERREALRLSARQHRRIRGNEKGLLWDEREGAWWAACRRSQRLRRWRQAGVALATAAAVAIAGWSVKRELHRRTLIADIVGSSPGRALWAAAEFQRRGHSDPPLEDVRDLTAWFEDGPLHPERLVRAGMRDAAKASRAVALLSKEEEDIDTDESREREQILAELRDHAGSEVLDASELVGPWLAARLDERRQELGAMFWAIDYFGGRHGTSEQRARAASLRTRLVGEIRKVRPELPSSLQWSRVDGGVFVMGSALDDDHFRHEVEVHAFDMLDHEVTNEEYRRFVPDHDPGAEAQLPVTDVSWREAYAFAAWLGGRLPTEAEWEYAARAGTQTEYSSGGDTEEALAAVGWYEGNTKERCAVKLKPPNDWGLYDMHGNAWEWTADLYEELSNSRERDPWGPSRGDARVLRGGSFGFDADWARSAYRRRVVPGFRNVFFGFRVLLPVAPSSSGVDPGS